jgi:perosamine synthetase
MTGGLSIDRILRIALLALKKYFISPYYGFIQGHDYLTKNILKNIHALVGNDNDEVVNDFERRFSALIGDGSSVAFAAGRMGFYSLMQEIGIKQGDHVVLQSSTCSVMVNAVLRIGAIPIYSDINDNTFSSSVNDIKNVLTSKTKMIVSQHSFGIPCDIEAISNFAKKQKIFLLEDCALTVGSSIGGKICGNFGDAALFSTDHSKPINTISGGLVYTNCTTLLQKLKNRQSLSSRINNGKQKKLWLQFNIERKYCNPKEFGKIKVIQLIYSNLFGLTRDVFNSSDYSSKIELNDEYPSKLPAFMALIGIQEIGLWPERRNERKRVLELMSKETESIFGKKLPSIYSDKNRDIIPLRLAWSCDEGVFIRKSLSSIVDMDSVWFLKPIVATNEPLINFKYALGTCPNSEKIGPNMINLPCNISYDCATTLIKNIKSIKI